MLNCAFRYSVSEVIPEGYLLPPLPHFVHHCCLILTIAVLINTFFPLYPIHCISTSIWSPFCSPLSLFNQRLMPEDSICMSFCCYGSSLHRQILWADNWASVCVLLPPGETTQSCLLTILTHTDIFRDWSIFSCLPAIWGACTCMLDLLFLKKEYHFNPQIGRDHLEFLCLSPFKIWMHDLPSTAEDIQLPQKQGDTPSCITQRKAAILECTHRFSPLQCVSLGCTSCHPLQVP